MSKRNTLAGKKARRDNRIARLNQTGIYHPIAGVQSAAPRQGKKNKYVPRRNTPKSERTLHRVRTYGHAEATFAGRVVTYGDKSALETFLGHPVRPRKGAKR